MFIIYLTNTVLKYLLFFFIMLSQVRYFRIERERGRLKKFDLHDNFKLLKFLIFIKQL